MNAITYWIAERFSFSAWPASLTAQAGSFQIVLLDVDWLRCDEGHYYVLTVGVLGFVASLGYWPDGKWGGA